MTRQSINYCIDVYNDVTNRKKRRKRKRNETTYDVSFLLAFLPLLAPTSVTSVDTRTIYPSKYKNEKTREE